MSHFQSLVSNCEMGAGRKILAHKILLKKLVKFTYFIIFQQ